MKLDYKKELINEIKRRNCKLSESELKSMCENELKITLDEVIMMRKYV